MSVSPIRNQVAFADEVPSKNGHSKLSVRIWDFGKGIQVWAKATGEITAMAFSPDGRTILTGQKDRWLEVWDVNGDQQLRTVRFEEVESLWEQWLRMPAENLKRWLIGLDRFDVTTVAYSASGDTIFAGFRDGRIRGWNSHTGETKCEFAGHTAEVTCIASSPDIGVILSSSTDGTVRNPDSSLSVWTTLLYTAVFASGKSIVGSKSASCYTEMVMSLCVCGPVSFRRMTVKSLWRQNQDDCVHGRQAPATK